MPNDIAQWSSMRQYMIDCLPDTIYNPEGFIDSLPAGFDGVFDWSFMKGCFPRPAIMPADVDAIVEVKGKFLIFETKKNKDIPIPQGQSITLKALFHTGLFTVVVMYGKSKVEGFTFYYPINGADKNKCRIVEGYGEDEARKEIKEWSKYAEPTWQGT